MSRANLRSLRSVAVTAAIITTISGCGGEDEASSPLATGQPRTQLIASDEHSADVRLSWTAPRVSVSGYRYHIGQNGSSWFDEGLAETAEVILSLPLGGNFRFCVAATSPVGEIGGERCTNFSTIPGAPDSPGDGADDGHPAQPPSSDSGSSDSTPGNGNSGGSDSGNLPAAPTDSDGTGQPVFEITGNKQSGVDVLARWARPVTTQVTGYRYNAGSNSGLTWTAQADVGENQALLSNVPYNGQFWFCVRGLTGGGETRQTCNSFSTPANPSVPAVPEPEAAGPKTNECANPRPEWIWCDDFERDRISSYFEASMRRRAGVGVNGSTGVVGRYLVGSSEAGNLKLAFGRTPSSYFRPVDDGTRNYREIYWRHYVRKPANWRGGGADKLSRATVFSGSNWQQAMIAHVWSGAENTQWANHLKIDPASGTNASGGLITTRYNDFANLRWLGARHTEQPVFGTGRNGEWQCVEARVRLNDAGRSNGIFELWVNDELSVARHDLNWVGSYSSYGINSVFLENFWNNRSPVEQERYMDNFVVSTDRIGC